MTLTQIKPAGLSKPIDLLDNEKIRLGTDVDLQLYSDNSNAVITAAGSGDLQLTSTNDDVIIQAADNIFINPQGGENGIKVYGDGGVKLYYDGSTDPKFETTASGCKISGTNLNMYSTYIDFSGSISTPSTAAAIYRPADNTLAFSTANTDRMIINQTGVGLGTTPAVSLDIHNTDSSTWNASSNLPTMIRAYNISPTTGASAGIQLRTDKSGGVAAIQYIHAVNNSTNYSSDLVFSRRIATTGAYGEQLRITNAGNLQVQSGRGVQFHNYGTGTNISSNTLDDYEEGTFDPSVQGFSSVSYTTRTGHYTKIGRLVYIDFFLRFGGSTTSDANHIYITNLPFNIQDTSEMRGGGTSSYYNLSSAVVDDGNISFYGAQGDNKFSTYVGSTPWYCGDGVSQSGKYLIGTFIYHAA